jgi:hypothetical protein
LDLTLRLILAVDGRGTIYGFHLVDFEEKRKYSNIEFEWMHTVGPTALKFLPYDILGEQYKMS